MKELDGILIQATAHIEDIYFHFPIDGSDIPIFRERVYCYALYHQMRLLWPTETPYYLNGEVDKAAHPILRELEADGSKPDLLVHQPGYLSGNYAVIEVKHFPADRQGVIKDLNTLNIFVNNVKYERAIYLLYGDDRSELLIKRVVEIAEKENIDFNHIEVWYHNEVLKPAKKLEH